jgi:hypothetical protein
MLQHLHLQGDIRNGYAEAIDLDLELSDGMYYGRLYIKLTAHTFVQACKPRSLNDS